MKVLTITKEEKSLLLGGAVVKVGGVNVVLDGNGKRQADSFGGSNPSERSLQRGGTHLQGASLDAAEPHKVGSIHLPTLHFAL